MFVFFLCIRCLVKTFFQRASSALLTAIADIGRLGKLRANIFFISEAGRSTLATCPAKLVIRVGATQTKFLERTLMKEGGTAVIERSA